MPRRTLQIILAMIVISYVCYQRAERNPYGRYFADILDHIDREYVEPVNDQDLFEGAIQGMLKSRLDDHSGFTTRAEATRFQESLDQEFGGIGVEVALDPQTKQLTVQSPIVGSPAYLAGIHAGDKIVAIDGRSTAGFQLENAQELLRGKPGHQVTLGIEHEDGGKGDYVVKRAIVKVDSVLGDKRKPDDHWDYLLPGHDRIGYLRIVTFGEHTVEEVQAALTDLEARSVQGVIIDLRDNSGGLLKSAIELCDMFLDAGQPIVSTRGREGKIREEHVATGKGSFRQLPLVLLVNQNSASASEIVAGCLQDHSRAVVGQRSFGKGTVQNVIHTEGGKSLLRLTVASYWRPSGKNIHRTKKNQETDDWGVKPDDGLEVKLTDEQYAHWRDYRRARDIVKPAETKAAEKPLDAPTEDPDPQLTKAVEKIEKMINAKP